MANPRPGVRPQNEMDKPRPASRRVPMATPPAAPEPSDSDRRLHTAAARSRAENTPGKATKPIKIEQGKRTTSSTAYGQELSHDELLDAVKFPPDCDPAFVRVAVGKTINMGNFESLRIEVAVTMPCHPSAIDTAYLDASEFVAEKLIEEEQEWLGAPKQKPTATRRS